MSMQNQSTDKTKRFTRQKIDYGEISVTVFDGAKSPYSYSLDGCNKKRISFGRGNGVDLLLDSRLVTHTKPHGFFVKRNGQWYVEDNGSLNGILYNNTSVSSAPVGDGDFIRIDDGIETMQEGVLFVFSAQNSENKWERFFLAGKKDVNIGRDRMCDICLPHITVSKVHARITCEQEGFFLSDCGSNNGTVLNDLPLVRKMRLYEKDVITITNSKIIFTPNVVYYCCYNNGVTVDAANIVVKRAVSDGKSLRRKKMVTVDNVSLSVKPGEMVAIVGGSGAGKSTVLNCMCGYLRPDFGHVYMNGVELYRNYDSLKTMIGYVPQSDIVYNDLTVYDMLRYSAKLRLPKDATREEREAAISRCLRLVELSEKKDCLIKSLSGGQKKRASIAVELLADPNLLFLDEPTSGLDPGTEHHLMHSLRNMVNGGKTVILVTHSTLQLRLFDKIVFMGTGGQICFCGDYESALRYFHVSHISSVYNLISRHAQEWGQQYRTLTDSGAVKTVSRSAVSESKPKKRNKRGQVSALCARYTRLLFNDRQRLFVLLAEGPLLAMLISLVANGDQFEQYEITKSLLFALTCAGIWIGMFDAITEVAKERTILKREYMSGLSAGSYLFSKAIVLGFLCLFQTALLVGTFAVSVGTPEKGIAAEPMAEIFVTTFLTTVASAATGLFISCIFRNEDKAVTVAPMLLILQILFSGVIFKLDAMVEKISWFAISRWCMEGYGSTANLNELELKLQQQGFVIPHEAETFYENTLQHLLTTWGNLMLFVLVFLVLARIVLASLRKAD